MLKTGITYPVRRSTFSSFINFKLYFILQFGHVTEIDLQLIFITINNDTTCNYKHTRDKLVFIKKRHLD